MARLVYGLLRSPVLTQAASQHPDLHTALRLLWTALPPAELRRAVYPLLSSYTTPDEQVRHGVLQSLIKVGALDGGRVQRSWWADGFEVQCG